MRRAAKTDANQAEIVEALRKAGARVQPLHQVGQGVPDLLIGFKGQTLLMECKDGSKPPSARKLTPDQQEWLDAWTGGAVWLVTCVDDALQALEESK